MLSLDQTLQRILELCNHCPSLWEGTREDPTFMRFSNAPVADDDKGMWYPVNTTLDDVFGKDCIQINVSKGPFGLPMVVDWVQKAWKHHTWDADSEKLIKVKLDNIVSALQDAGAEDKFVEQPDCTVGKKQRVLSNPKISNVVDPPSKQARLELNVVDNSSKLNIINNQSNAIIDIDKSDLIVLSSDSSHDDRDVPINEGSKIQKCQLKQMNLIEICPLSRPGNPCKQCKVEKCLGGKLFSCHCGANTIWLGKGRVRSAEAHWATETCKDKTNNLKNNTQLTSYFKTSTAPNPNLIMVSCAGLNNNTWEPQENKLTSAQKAQLIATLDARSKWQNDKDAVCDACEEVKGLRSLLAALNRPYAKGETLKFSRNNYMSENSNSFSPQLLKKNDFRLLSISIESSANGDFSDFMTVVAASARNGLFSDCKAMRGLIKAVAIKAEREKAGKTTQGMKIDLCLDDFVMILGAISPRALSLFNDNFAGRGNRSLLLKNLGYLGPIASASDQTVCVKHLCHYNGCLVGAQGGDISFEDASELPDLVKLVVNKKELCSKVSYTSLSSPSKAALALIASADKETSNDILESHIKFLKLADEAGIKILSIGADGAPTKLCAQAALSDSATQYLTYSNSNLDVHIKVPLMGNPPTPVVMVQDPKHAGKTAANQLSSGACLLIIDLEDPDEASPENLADVSVCVTQHYNIEYGYEVDRTCKKEALEAAAHLTSKQNSISLLLETLPNNTGNECLRNAAMSISNLLNPAPDLHPQSIPCDGDIAIGSFVIDNKLIETSLIAVQKHHGSELVKHKGNEQNIIHPDELRLELTNTTKSGGLQASACSKIIAVCFKNLEEVPTGEACRHQWNINVNINLSGIVKDTANLGQVHLQGLMDGGEIKPSNPIKPGSFIIVIKNHTLYLARTLVVYKLINKKHTFVTSAEASKGLSHIAVQILFYDPAVPVITPCKGMVSTELTYSLLDATDVVYIFEPSAGSTFLDIRDQDTFEVEYRCNWSPLMARLQSLLVPHREVLLTGRITGYMPSCFMWSVEVTGVNITTGHKSGQSISLPTTGSSLGTPGGCVRGKLFVPGGSQKKPAAPGQDEELPPIKDPVVSSKGKGKGSGPLIPSHTAGTRCRPNGSDAE
ncbi:hypothetical protein DFH28DRAFT_1121611 [Melampsora americana]|nr:hypothetical protein DFH28DRAFT_1121611 [Melampsora americana]